MPLEMLNLSGTDVSDVSPLFGAPLKRLVIDDIRNKIGNVDALIDEDMEVKKEISNRTIILDFIRNQKTGTP